MPYMTITAGQDGFWHCDFSLIRSGCCALLTDRTIRIGGVGKDTMPEPARHEMCPVCFPIRTPQGHLQGETIYLLFQLGFQEADHVPGVPERFVLTNPRSPHMTQVWVLFHGATTIGERWYDAREGLDIRAFHRWWENETKKEFEATAQQILSHTRSLLKPDPLTTHGVDLGGGYTAVPFEAVTLNGMFLPQLVESSRGTAVAVIGPDRQALQGESGRPHRYDSVEEAQADVRVLQKIEPAPACAEPHQCHCGTAESTPHLIGEDGCVRRMVEAPQYLGEKPDTGFEIWKVDGHCVTSYTLKNQRGYYQHPCGCWSRWPGSENSISDET